MLFLVRVFPHEEYRALSGCRIKELLCMQTKHVQFDKFGVCLSF